MNPKNALFLSATLTAFALAILFAVVNKVTTTPIEAAAAPAVQNTATDVPATDAPSATAQTPLGPEEAANIAAKVINRTDVYSVESYSYNGVDTYKVVFSAGNIVYVNLDRHVIGMEMASAATVTAAPPVAAGAVIYYPTDAPKKHKSGSSGGGSGTGSGGGGGGTTPPPHDGGGHDD